MQLADRVQETSSTTGTGTLSLSGAASSYRTFVAGVGSGGKCYYAVKHRTANEWEVGIGTVTDATPDTLSRDRVIASSNSGSAVSFSAGTKDVFVTFPAMLGDAAQFYKKPVRVATTGAGTLASDYENGDTVDGVVLATGDRILVKDQATASQNGIYIVAASGAPARASDLFTGDAAAGIVVPVKEGTANADKLFLCTTNSGSDVVGTNNLAFAAAGTTDHGSLGGLSDDDHSQYLRADGTRALTGDQSAGGFKITNLDTPSSASDAATKAYADSVAANLQPKAAVRAATTTAGTLASDFENGDTIDGVVLATGNRILLQDQADPIENGIYVVAASGAPTRASDLAAAASAAGAYMFVQEGTANGDKAFVCTNDSGSDVVGTDGLVFSQFSGGSSDHGDLAGLGDDDHSQYLLTAGTRAFTGDQSVGGFKLTNLAAPTSDNDAARKVYVDDAVAAAGGIAEVADDPTPTLGGDLDCAGADLLSVGVLNLGAVSGLTIASGAVTATQSLHSIDTEGAAASDDLDTINGGAEGDVLVLYLANSAHLVNLTESGNIQLPDFTGSVYQMDGSQLLLLAFNGTKWLVLHIGVRGPVGYSVTDESIARWDGSTGRAIQHSIGNTIDDNGKYKQKSTYADFNDASDGATVTFDCNLANKHRVTLGDNRTLALSNVSVGQVFEIRLLQDGTGSRTVTWFSTIKWAGGAAPTLTTTAGKADVFVFQCTSSGQYDGFVAGQNL